MTQKPTDLAQLEPADRKRLLQDRLGWTAAASGLAIVLVSAITYQQLFISGSHRCGVVQLALMALGALLVMAGWRTSNRAGVDLLRRVTAGLFFLTALTDVLLHGWQTSLGYLVALVVIGISLLVWPRQAISIERMAMLGLSLLLTFAGVVLPLEVLLRSDYSKYHLLGVYDHLPASLEPALINARGYRDVEHSLAKPPGVVRILVMGDSFTYGWAVADDQVYTRLLAQLAGPGVEVISMARNGWSTANELVAFRQEGLAYAPDIVVMGVVTNDPEPLPDLEILLDMSKWSIFTCLPLHLTTFKFLDYQINNFGGWCGLRYDYEDWERDLFDPNQPYWPAWQQTTQEFGQELKAHHIQAFAFTLPAPGDYQSKEYAQKYALLAQGFRTAGFQMVDLWPVYTREFVAVPFKSLWALPNDTHPGPQMNAFYARQMWQALQPAVEKIRAGRSS